MSIAIAKCHVPLVVFTATNCLYLLIASSPSTVECSVPLVVCPCCLFSVVCSPIVVAINNIVLMTSDCLLPIATIVSAVESADSMPLHCVLVPSSIVSVSSDVAE